MHRTQQPARSAPSRPAIALAERLVGILAGCVLCCLSGCGGDETGMRVWGEVTYGGEPVQEGTILFTPADGAEAPSAGGVIKNGMYDIAANKGPRAGVAYVVSIEALKTTGQRVVTPMNAEGDEVKVQYIPPEYNAKSSLKYNVSSSAQEHRTDFTLEKINAGPR